MRRKRKKHVFIISFAFILLLTAAVCYHNRSVFTANLDSRPLNIGVVGTIDTAEPALISNHAEELLASMLYEGLVTYDEKTGSIKSNLAKSWKYAPEEKTLTIKLDPHIKFINDKKLTAAAVKKAWENNISNAKEWSTVSNFLAIAGAKERLQGKQSDVAGIQAVDDNTLKIVLQEANPVFISVLTNPLFWVFDPDDKADTPAGTGPFTVQENKDNKHIVLVRNDRYHHGFTKLAAIDMNVYSDENQALAEYKAGKLDYLDDIPLKEIAALKSSDQYKKLLIEKPLLDTYSIAFNLNKEPFKNNYQLRRAINYAIDRNAIIEKIRGGAARPIKGVIPQGTPGYNKDLRGYTYDLDKAKKLLSEAGYPNGDGLKPIILTFNADEGHNMIAAAIGEQLGQIGIKIQTQALDWDYYTKQINAGNLTFFRLEWQADYPDADSFLYCLYDSSRIGTSNYNGYINSQVDKILDDARAENKNQQQRLKLLSRAEEIIVDDAPCLWLFQGCADKLVSPNVKDLNVDCMDRIDWSKVELLKPMP